MQRLLSQTLAGLLPQRSARAKNAASTTHGLQQAVSHALIHRHADVLRHLASQHSRAAFAGSLIALPSRQRNDVLSLLAPEQRLRVLALLPRQQQQQWHGARVSSSPDRKRWMNGLRPSPRQSQSQRRDG